MTALITVMETRLAQNVCWSTEKHFRNFIQVCTDIGFSIETVQWGECFEQKTKKGSKIKPQNCQTCIYNFLSDLFIKQTSANTLREAHHNIALNKSIWFIEKQKMKYFNKYSKINGQFSLAQYEY